MQRKRGTEHPTTGESSGSQESGGSGGQGGGWQQYSVGTAPVMQQQGGGRGGRGRGSPFPQPPKHGGHGDECYQGGGAGLQPHRGMTNLHAGAPEYQPRGGPLQPRGGMVPRQLLYHRSQGGASQPCGGGTPQFEYQGRGVSQPRSGMPPHQHPGVRTGGGHMVGWQVVGPSTGPTRPSGLDLHQAAQVMYQASLPSPKGGASSSSQIRPSEITFGRVEQQLQQLSVQGENKPTQAIQIAAPAASRRSMRFPSRPGMGTVGKKKCIVKANHFLVELPDKDLHQYDFTITPEVTSHGVNRAIMKRLISLYQQSHLGGRLPAYDGRKSLYATGPLPFRSKIFEINLLDEEDGASGQRREVIQGCN